MLGVGRAERVHACWALQSAMQEDWAEARLHRATKEVAGWAGEAGLGWGQGAHAPATQGLGLSSPPPRI
jgi:hypothetical protein